MGVQRPKSPDGLAAFAGPDGYWRFIARLTTGDFGLSRADAGSLTYRVGWDHFIAPWMESVKAMKADVPEGEVGERPAAQNARAGGGKRMTVTSNYLNDQPLSEVNKLLDKMCGDRVYDGPKWWLDPKAHGYSVYTGKD